MAQDQFIKDLLEGRLSKEELEKARKNDQSIEEVEKIVEGSAQFKVPKGKSKEQAWDDFLNKVDTEKPAKIRKLNPIWPVAIAAVLVLAIVAYVFVFSGTTINTAPGERLTHVLPDGSVVTLNAASTISYNSFGWESERTVKLDGEAFFDVKNGNPFLVAGDESSVTVLGTSFNVFFRNGESRVACFEGSVRVSSPSGDSAVTLKKGEASTNLNPSIRFDNQKTATWKKGEFYFENHPLRLVVEELERQYDVTIQYESPGKRTYTGYFNDQNLNEALQLVFKPMGLTFEIKDDKVIVQ